MMYATRKHRRKGFTLIETAITTVIVGLGTVAMMALLAAGTSTNQQTATLTTAVHLADNIHELCEQLQLSDFGRRQLGIAIDRPIGVERH
jgi:prepilin-type N-terminal cleavage/methylation domain-containing protein